MTGERNYAAPFMPTVWRQYTSLEILLYRLFIISVAGKQPFMCV